MPRTRAVLIASASSVLLGALSGCGADSSPRDAETGSAVTRIGAAANGQTQQAQQTQHEPGRSASPTSPAQRLSLTDKIDAAVGEILPGVGVYCSGTGHYEGADNPMAVARNGNVFLFGISGDGIRLSSAWDTPFLGGVKDQTCLRLGLTKTDAPPSTAALDPAVIKAEIARVAEGEKPGVGVYCSGIGHHDGADNPMAVMVNGNVLSMMQRGTRVSLTSSWDTPAAFGGSKEAACARLGLTR